MAPQVTFPAHTQARMVAVRATKEVDRLKKPSDDQPGTTFQYPTLPGEVRGLNVSARQWILQSDAEIVIGCDTLQAFVALVKNVNLAILDYYVPYIVANHKYTMPGGDVIILPYNMTLVTQRGLKYVVTNMKREMEQGSYTISHFKNSEDDAAADDEDDDDDDEATCMIRPSRNPVDMIHALNTLRAFGLFKDARFLAMEDGPIMTGLKRRASEWDGTLRTLKRFLNTVSRELLVGSDRYLLAPAWAVYDERLRAKLLSKTSGCKA